eukprot:scaffold77779_cov22-Tisochrysis_lutea.AAC.2
MLQGGPGICWKEPCPLWLSHGATLRQGDKISAASRALQTVEFLAKRGAQCCVISAQQLVPIVQLQSTLIYSDAYGCCYRIGGGLSWYGPKAYHKAFIWNHVIHTPNAIAICMLPGACRSASVQVRRGFQLILTLMRSLMPAAPARELHPLFQRRQGYRKKRAHQVRWQNLC